MWIFLIITNYSYNSNYFSNYSSFTHFSFFLFRLQIVLRDILPKIQTYLCVTNGFNDLEFKRTGRVPGEGRGLFSSSFRMQNSRSSYAKHDPNDVDRNKHSTIEIEQKRKEKNTCENRDSRRI